MRAAIFFLTAAGLVTAHAMAHDSKGGGEGKAGGKAAPPRSYVNAGEVTGEVTKIDESARTIEVRVRVRSGRGWTTEKMDYTFADEVKFRTMTLPDRLDENDKVRPYTAQEKAKLKGDSKLPGYVSEIGAVKKGQTVVLTLGTPKPAPGSPRKKGADSTEKPVVTMLVIMPDSPKATDNKK
jgi:hypothetical protein